MRAVKAEVRAAGHKYRYADRVVEAVVDDYAKKHGIKIDAEALLRELKRSKQPRRKSRAN